MDKIFIQIASYRDPELIPTIRDCIAKAEFPERLTFGVCWQHSDEESLEEFSNNKSIRVIDVQYTESKGLCWARSLTQTLWEGEEFTLQLDSHHRFAKNWDSTLIKMARDLQSAGYKKPLLSAYVGAYVPEEDQPKDETPFRNVFNYFRGDHTFTVAAIPIDNWESQKLPVPGAYVSGHQIFTLGIHTQEVPYDPYLYYDGEEINVAVRSFTHGYDLFCPNRNVIWHYYGRNTEKKHWDDKSEWYKLDQISKQRIRNLLGIESTLDLGKYSLGDKRTLADYELYSGVSFKTRNIHQKVLRQENFPINENAALHKIIGREFILNIEVPAELHDKELIFISVENYQGIRFGQATVEMPGLRQSTQIKIFSTEYPENLSFFYLEGGVWTLNQRRGISEKEIFFLEPLDTE